MNRTLGLLLFACVVFALGFLVGRGTTTERVRGGAGSGPTPCAPRAIRQLVAYYFHPTVRSAACFEMETRAEDAIRKGFPAHVALEEVVWRTANLDDAWNRDFVERYGLDTSTLVLVSTLDGRELGHRVLDALPALADDEAATQEYVKAEVKQALEEGVRR